MEHEEHFENADESKHVISEIDNHATTADTLPIEQSTEDFRRAVESLSKWTLKALIEHP